MDPAIGQFLIGLGGPGIVILYLLFDRRSLKTELIASQAQTRECQIAHMADIKKYSTDITAALTTSAELMRVNNGIQEKAAASATLIAEAVREVTFRLKALEDQIGDLKP